MWGLDCVGSFLVKFRCVLSILARYICDKMLVVSVLCFFCVVFFKGKMLAKYFDAMLSDVPWDARGQIYASFITSFFILFGVFVTYNSWKKQKIADLKLDYILELSRINSKVLRKSSMFSSSVKDVSMHIEKYKNGDVGNSDFRIGYIKESVARIIEYGNDVDRSVSMMQDHIISYAYFLTQHKFHDGVQASISNVSSSYFVVLNPFHYHQAIQRCDSGISMFLDDYDVSSIGLAVSEFDNAIMALSIVIGALIASALLTVDSFNVQQLRMSLGNINKSGEMLYVMKSGVPRQHVNLLEFINKM